MYIRPDNAQHIGGRERQEDSFGFSSFDQHDVINKRGIAAVVADGMGGLTHGRDVSHLAVQSFLSFYQDLTHDEELPNLLQKALIHANYHVLHFARENGLQSQVGSTFIGAAIKDGDLYWISAGDSRIYLYRQNELIPLTTDHVFANILNQEAALGKITKEVAENHPQKGALTSFIGLEEIEEIDQNFVPFPLQPGDRVLLCSDGLYGFIPEAEIVQILFQNQENACEALVEKVLEKKHPFQDNITAILLDYGKTNVQTTKTLDKPPTVTSKQQPSEKQSRTSNRVKKRWFVTILVPIIIVIFLLVIGVTGYVFVFKDGDFHEIKDKILTVLHLKEKPKQPKEGGKSQ